MNLVSNLLQVQVPTNHFIVSQLRITLLQALIITRQQIPLLIVFRNQLREMNVVEIIRDNQGTKGHECKFDFLGVRIGG